MKHNLGGSVIILQKTLYICKLGGDFKQNKFGEILDLIPLCNSVTKLHAYCAICKDGTHNHFTKRIINNDEQKLIGTNK